MGLLRRLVAALIALVAPRRYLQGLLVDLRAAGVREYRCGSMTVVFRDDLETPAAPEAPAMDRLQAAARGEPEARPAPAARPPTPDELLYGTDGYGLPPRPSDVASS